MLSVSRVIDQVTHHLLQVDLEFISRRLGVTDAADLVRLRDPEQFSSFFCHRYDNPYTLAQAIDTQLRHVAMSKDGIADRYLKPYLKSSDPLYELALQCSREVAVRVLRNADIAVCHHAPVQNDEQYAIPLVTLLTNKMGVEKTYTALVTGLSQAPGQETPGGDVAVHASAPGSEPAAAPIVATDTEPDFYSLASNLTTEDAKFIAMKAGLSVAHISRIRNAGFDLEPLMSQKFYKPADKAFHYHTCLTSSVLCKNGLSDKYLVGYLKFHGRL